MDYLYLNLLRIADLYRNDQKMRNLFEDLAELTKKREESFAGLYSTSEYEALRNEFVAIWFDSAEEIKTYTQKRLRKLIEDLNLFDTSDTLF